MTVDDALLSEIEAFAVEIARDAGAILKGHFGRSLDVEYKDEAQRDPVSNADKETQEFLTEVIVARFPAHGVLGEEGKEDTAEQESSPAPDIVWVLDPLDGTKNYLNGLPVFASSIGVLHRGVPVAGAVYIPWPTDGGGAVLHARKGGGAFFDDQPIPALDSDAPTGRSLVALPGYFVATHSFRKPMRGKVGEVRNTGSIAYDLAMVATGVLQYSIAAGPYLWDVAGGAAIVIESGGLIMRGRRVRGGVPFSSATKWEPVESFLPTWESGVTTLKDLRSWSAPVAVGSPGVIRHVTSNIRTRRRMRRRLSRAVRKLLPSKKRSPASG